MSSDHALLGCRGEEQVDEARRPRPRALANSGDAGKRVDQRLCDLARIALERFGELQRQIASVVAVTRLLGALERDGAPAVVGKHFLHRGSEQLRQMGARGSIGEAVCHVHVVKRRIIPARPRRTRVCHRLASSAGKRS